MWGLLASGWVRRTGDLPIPASHPTFLLTPVKKAARAKAWSGTRETEKERKEKYLLNAAG